MRIRSCAPSSSPWPRTKGLVGVNIAAQAESHYFAKNPIRRLADFQGKKLRVNATAAERARMQAFGATAVPMGLAEMITSLQSGVIDGTMSGISIYVNFNLQTVSKTITETNDTLLVSFGAMSKKWLDTLPADLRKIVIDEARGLQRGRSSSPTTRRSRCGRNGSSAAARSSTFRPTTWQS